MPVARAFIDTTVLLYLLSSDASKADRAEVTVRAGGLTSVQVLNEIANVARRKLAMPWTQLNEVLLLIRSLCAVEPLSVAMHECGRRVAERYGFSVHDAMIVGAALVTGCETLYSEDMHDGLLVDHQLRVCTPFTTPAL